MWIVLAFLSACLLGFYDVFKKLSLKDNAVLPVLCLSVGFSTIFLLPFLFLSSNAIIDPGTLFYANPFAWSEQKFYILKALIVMGSWICGYMGIKYLPITIVGPINATRPMIVLIGAMMLLGERLNFWQWVGVIVAFIAFILLSRSGKKEGIDFRSNRWIIFVILSNILGAISALYDRWLLSPNGLYCDKISVQLWNNLYQFILLAIIVFVSRVLIKGYKAKVFSWRWSIVMISVCLSIADFVYFWALGQQDALVSIVSMIRRGSVVVSFTFGALIFKEKNLRSKVIDLVLVLLSMVFIFIGSR